MVGDSREILREWAVTLDRFYFMRDGHWMGLSLSSGLPYADSFLIMDRDAFEARLSNGLVKQAYRDGYDVIMESEGHVWRRFSMRVEPADVAQLHAKILAVRGMEVGSDQVEIETDQGTIWMYHEQECCEQVEIVDVTGDPEDLVGGTLVLFDQRTHLDVSRTKGLRLPDKRLAELDPFAFYELRTTKGDVNLRWQKVTDTMYGVSVVVRFKDAQ